MMMMMMMMRGVVVLLLLLLAVVCRGRTPVMGFLPEWRYASMDPGQAPLVLPVRFAHLA